MEYSSAFCAAWKVSLSELRMKTCTHTCTLTLTHTLRVIGCRAWPWIQRQLSLGARDVSLVSDIFDPASFASGLFFCAAAACMFLLFPFFSPLAAVVVVVLVLSRQEKKNAQRLGTYASSWDTNGLKSNLSRIRARPREGPTDTQTDET